MVDNFELIKPLLKFDSEDDFYFAQIIQRKKDNPGTSGTNNNARLIKAYYIKSIDQLEKQSGEMILLANHYNARVGINLNRRSFERTAFHTLKKITDQIMNKDYKSVRRAFNSVCGEYSNGDKSWILDVDTKDTSFFNPLIEELKTLQPIGDEKYIATIPTKNGYHIITRPFDLSKFSFLFGGWHTIPRPDIHKNNPTILYIP